MIGIIFFLTAFDYTINSHLHFFYDDNIFEYSRKHLDEFMQGLYKERYPFETYDDICANLKLQLLIRNKFFSLRTTTFNFNLITYNYLINRQKNYFVLSSGIRQSLGYWAVKFEYLLIPYYLIRYYKAPEENEYIGCEFKEHLFTLKINRDSDKINLGMRIGYELDDYIEKFNIYDSKALRLEPFFDYSARKGSIGLTYEYKSSKAKGPIPDISYLQHKIEVNPELKFILPKLSRIGFEYQLKYRIFTTEVSPVLDTPHSGRIDNTHSFKLSYEFPISPGFNFSFNYTYEFRNAYSEVYPEIKEYKNYTKWIVGCGLEFFH